MLDVVKAPETTHPEVVGPDSVGTPGGARANQVVALVLAIIGLRIGMGSLYDNSFLTHLATGRLILDDGVIPRSDPYSFTAFGDPWTVQSWGASVIFAGIEQMAGLGGIRVLVGLLSAATAVLAWKLTSAAEGLVGRLLIAVPVLAIGAGLWVERPLIFSLVLLLGVLFAIEGRLDARMMVPVFLIWVNLHGSFVLGLAAIAAYGVGRALDRDRPTRELRVFVFAAAGTFLGGLLSPLGPKLLVFPLQLLQRREAFVAVAEWKPPTWQQPVEIAFALQLVIALGLVLLRYRRWRSIVPIVCFAAISLQSTRNIVHASLVMLPAMAIAAQGLGTIDGRRPVRILRPVVMALWALLAVTAAIGLRLPDTDFSDYPVASAAWMRSEGLLDTDDRVVSRDFVGNYLEFRYGPDEVRVFIDDRVDMYPTDLIADYGALLDEGTDFAAILERADATAVLWDRDSAFGDWLEDPGNGWEIVHDEDRWMVAVPADA